MPYTQEFKNTVLKKVEKELSAYKGEYTIQYRNARKPEDRDGFTVSTKEKPGSGKQFAMLIFYFDDLHEIFTESGSMEVVWHYIQRILDKDPIFQEKIRQFDNTRLVRTHVVPQIINLEKDNEMSKKRFHLDFLDLSIAFRVVIDCGDEGVASFFLNENCMKVLGVNEEELLQLAKKNAESLLHFMVTSQASVLQDIAKRHPENDRVAKEAERDPLHKFWIISAEEPGLGSSALVCKNIIKQLSDSLMSDLFLIPATTNELFVREAGIEQTDAENDILSRTVDMIRKLYPHDDPDWLTDSLYRFDRKTGEISIVQNNL